jgi:hypothetical protein
MRGWGIEGVTAVVAGDSNLIDADFFLGYFCLTKGGVMSDEIMASIEYQGFELTGSQSLVLDGHEADYHLVLVFYGRILGLRS